MLDLTIAVAANERAWVATTARGEVLARKVFATPIDARTSTWWAIVRGIEAGLVLSPDIDHVTVVTSAGPIASILDGRLAAPTDEARRALAKIEAVVGHRMLEGRHVLWDRNPAVAQLA